MALSSTTSTSTSTLVVDSFSLGRGSFTLVSSGWRVRTDLKTTHRSNFSKAFLIICSLTPLTYGITASGGFLSSSWDPSSCGSSSDTSSGGVDGTCMEGDGSDEG